MAKIKVLESNITILKDDYISLTDMVKNKNTIEFIGIWEEMYKVDFNSPEFEGIKNEAG